MLCFKTLKIKTFTKRSPFLKDIESLYRRNENVSLFACQACPSSYVERVRGSTISWSYEVSSSFVVYPQIKNKSSIIMAVISGTEFNKSLCFRVSSRSSFRASFEGRYIDIWGMLPFSGEGLLHTTSCQGTLTWRTVITFCENRGIPESQKYFNAPVHSRPHYSPLVFMCGRSVILSQFSGTEVCKLVSSWSPNELCTNEHPFCQRNANVSLVKSNFPKFYRSNFHATS